MKRVNLDTAPKSVKEFVRGLPLRREGVELELGGQVICEVMPPGALSTAERAALTVRVRERAYQSRRRHLGVPPRVVERAVEHAVEEVRRRHKA